MAFIAVALIYFILYYNSRYVSTADVNVSRNQVSTLESTEPEATTSNSYLSDEPTNESFVTTSVTVSADKTVKHTWFTTFLLIMTPILPSSFRSRETIRNTWYKGFTDSKDVMLRFAMGIKGVDANTTKLLADENSTHKDLIFFENLKENRSALTNKTLLLMKWAYANINFTYFLKCDDDTFVFVKRTLNELKKRPTTKRLYYGKILFHGVPNQKGDWKDLQWKLADTYMPFAQGGGYILSSDLISLIVEDSPFLQWHPNEDTAVGSWLAPYKYERRTDKKICITSSDLRNVRRCAKYVIMHLFYGIPRGMLDKVFMEYSKQS